MRPALSTAVAAVCILAACALAYLAGSIQNAPAHHPGCHAEDEVPVYVAQHSYDMPAGLPMCAHIDQIRDPR